MTCNFKHDLCPIGRLLSKQSHKTIGMLTTFITVIFLITLMTDQFLTVPETPNNFRQPPQNLRIPTTAANPMLSGKIPHGF